MDSPVIAKGQVWLLVYEGEVVRMRITGISVSGQVTLLEVHAGTARRALSTTASGLLLSGALDDRAEIDDDPTLSDRPG